VDQVVDVRDAAVAFGAGVPCRVRHPAQEAFLQGHVLAFVHLGAVPARIRTENVPRNNFGVPCPGRYVAGPPESPVLPLLEDRLPTMPAT